jgi:hypothetical protein
MTGDALDPFHRVRYGALVSMVLLGCRPDDAVDPPLTEPLEGTTTTATRAVGNTGVGTAEVRLFTLNDFGAAVASADQTVQVDGLDQSVDINGRGRGVIRFETAGSHRVELPSGEVVEAHVVDGTWSSPWLRPGDLAPSAVDVIPVGPDRAIFDGEGVWWAGQGPAEPILTLPPTETYGGMVTGDLDVDGVVDLAVWTDASIYVLRGNGPDEGFSWGAGFRGIAGTLVGVDFADFDSDGTPDLFAAWVLEGSAVVQVSRGVGLLAYEVVQTITPVGTPSVLAVANGGTELTVLTEPAPGEPLEWNRFALTEAEGLFQQTSSEAPATLPVGARIFAEGDFHGDGVEDLVLIGPTVPGEPTIAQLFDLTESPPTFIQRSPVGAFVRPADANDDGVADLWSVLDNGDVKVLSAAGSQPVEFGVGSLGVGGPFAVTPRGPGLPVLWSQVGDHWQQVQGEVDDAGPIWRIPVGNFDNLLVHVDAAWPTASDTAVEWAGVQLPDDGSVYVKRWSFTPGAAAVTELTRVEVAVADETLDTARCADFVYVLVDGELSRTDLSVTAGDVQTLPSEGATRVACIDSAFAL